jgi:hypothetical protein
LLRNNVIPRAGGNPRKSFEIRRLLAGAKFRHDNIESMNCHAGRGRSPRAGTQDNDFHPWLAALGAGYFAGAKFRHDSEPA